MGLHAINGSSTDPHVEVVNLDLSYQDTWWHAQRTALSELAQTIGLQGRHRIRYTRDYISLFVVGWHTDAVNDGYLLIRSRRRLRKEGQVVLRMTGFRQTPADRPPNQIHCLLYETEHTELVRQMLASLGRTLGVRYSLRVVLARRQPMDDWRWLPNAGKRIW